MANGSNQNRKLTPSKVNIGIKANSSMGHHPSQPGRNYEAGKQKVKASNSRSNTIEQAPFERDSKKNIKKQKERASSTIENDLAGSQNFNGMPQQPHHQPHNSHIIGNNAGGHVQVSNTGTLLIGPGGRPKTSQGKNQQPGQPE